MALTSIEFSELKRRVGDACGPEDAFISTFRAHARRMKEDVKVIHPVPIQAVSFVSSGGGEERLYFNPDLVQVLRIVDSTGCQCALDAISGNTRVADFIRRTDKESEVLVEPLERFCRDLGVKVPDLSHLLGGVEEPGSVGLALRAYRDILEWAVLYDLANGRQWSGDTIVVREGMLRSRSFKPTVFTRLKKLLRAACKQRKRKNVAVSPVGMAPPYAVPSLLSVALELEEALHKPYPCYVRVPDDLADSCYRFNRTRMPVDPASLEEGGDHRYQALGQLFLVKFGTRVFDPVWPVDIAEWDAGDPETILGGLTSDAQPGFPIPDYPMCLQRAHDVARISPFEADILQDIFLEGLAGRYSPADREKLLRMKYLAQHLTHIKQKNA